jgi:hypothetical protein
LLSNPGLPKADLTCEQNGLTHAFISEFETEEDRRYYLERDPSYLEFGRSISGIVAQVQVIDFSPGVF